MTATSSPAAGRAAFIFIFLTVALDMLALGIIAPVLPKLLVQLEGGDVARGAEVVGVFGFAWALMQFIFSPLSGVASDRFGRRPVILASNLGLGIDYVLMAVAPSIPWLFVGRLVSGITAASFPAATAYIADVTPPEQRAAKFGVLGAAFGLGFIIGPALGGVLGDIDLRLPFWAAGGLSIANALYGFFILPESLPRERRTAFSWAKANPLGAMRLLGSQRALLALALSSFLFFIAHEVLPNVFVLYAMHRYGWDERDVGLSLGAVGVGSALVAAVLMGPVVARLGERRAALVGFCFGVVGLTGFGLASTGAWFLAALPFVSLWGFSGPAMQALMSKRVAASAQGALQGAVSSLRGVCGMIGPLLFTTVFAQAIRAPDDEEITGAPYFVAAALLAASAIVAALATRRTADAGEPLVTPDAAA